MRRCSWCAIQLRWWERLLRRAHCLDCHHALVWDYASPPYRAGSRRTVCRRYRYDHEVYCPGHHAEHYG